MEQLSGIGVTYWRSTVWIGATSSLSLDLLRISAYPHIIGHWQNVELPLTIYSWLTRTRRYSRESYGKRMYYQRLPEMYPPIANYHYYHLLLPLSLTQ